MPTPNDTFAMSGRTFHKGERYSLTDPVVVARPDLFDVPKPTRKTTKKDGDR